MCKLVDRSLDHAVDQRYSPHKEIRGYIRFSGLLLADGSCDSAGCLVTGTRTILVGLSAAWGTCDGH